LCLFHYSKAQQEQANGLDACMSNFFCFENHKFQIYMQICKSCTIHNFVTTNPTIVISFSRAKLNSMSIEKHTSFSKDIFQTFNKGFVTTRRDPRNETHVARESHTWFIFNLNIEKSYLHNIHNLF
jgi:hypothetical protein